MRQPWVRGIQVSESTVTTTIAIQGMTCAGCERKIERALARVPGVSAVKGSYARGTAQITYEPGTTDIGALRAAVEAAGYDVLAARPVPGQVSARVRALWAAGALLALFAVFTQLNRTGIANAFPTAKAGMGYGMLFVIGVLTSVHCVAMCGGISLSQCVSSEQGAEGALGTSALRPDVLRAPLLYNVGRVTSYTVVGGVAGALGSIVGFSGTARGVVQLAAGVFMVIMGMNMLDVFPWLRRLTPRLPKALTAWAGGPRGNGPLVVGLLNGMMPCGPLQAMQLYALSTGSAFSGALSMLLFSLGTVPLMFGLGALSSVLSKRFTSRMMTASAALVVTMGVFMFTNGVVLSGMRWRVSAPVPAPASGRAQVSTQAPATGDAAGAAAAAQDAPEQGLAVAGSAEPVQEVRTRLSPGYYEPITVEAGVPVRWTIVAGPGSLNGCNEAIVIPAYGIQRGLQYGENVIEFTPTEPGKVPFSCWMGMIRSAITVR